jgi:hypothetical protein
MTTPFCTSAFDLPSNRCAAFRTMVWSAAIAVALRKPEPISVTRKDLDLRKQKEKYIPADIKIQHAKQGCRRPFNDEARMTNE